MNKNKINFDRLNADNIILFEIEGRIESKYEKILDDIMCKLTDLENNEVMKDEN